MNQIGNEPMITLHARIPVALMDFIEKTSVQAGISKSEFIRLALEYVQTNDLQLAKKVTFKSGL